MDTRMNEIGKKNKYINILRYINNEKYKAENALI